MYGIVALEDRETKDIERSIKFLDKQPTQCLIRAKSNNVVLRTYLNPVVAITLVILNQEEEGWEFSFVFTINNNMSMHDSVLDSARVVKYLLDQSIIVQERYHKMRETSIEKTVNCVVDDCFAISFNVFKCVCVFSCRISHSDALVED